MNDQYIKPRTDERLRTTNQTLRHVVFATMMLAAATAHAGASPIPGVVNGVNIVLATVTAVCLAIATIGVGICGYKVIFDGATFRDVSNKLLGCAISGAAGGIAAMFMTG